MQSCPWDRLTTCISVSWGLTGWLGSNFAGKPLRVLMNSKLRHESHLAVMRANSVQ